jgi:2,3-bisphosphoglycerate-independent phosphoglycerate mutase
MAKKTCVLIILDGWGIGPKNDANAIYRATIPTIEYIKKNYPAASLQSAGIAVGLPWDEPGNSEVGHLTLGAGRVIYQHYPRISLAVRNGDFLKNQELNEAFNHSLNNNSNVHILGLLSSGNVHSSYEHLQALIKLASTKKCPNVFFHLFTDGKDSAPQSAKSMVEKLQNDLKKFGVGQLASLTGRYYALDRRKNWAVTQKYYNLIVKGEGRKASDPLKMLDNYYAKDITDPYIEPTLIFNPEKSETAHLIKDNDSLIFFDFREDSIKQIVTPFASKDFKDFEASPLNNLKITTMTNYDDAFNASVAFPPEKVINGLSEILSNLGLTQLKIAETEKFYHLTYFFNCLSDKVFNNEFRVLVPSKETPHLDDSPEMRAPEITDRLITALNENIYNFIAVNYANPDTMGHTGNFNATVKGIEIVDQQLAKVLEAAKKVNADIIITADHGNAEKLYDSRTGEKETCHNPNPVPFYLISEKYKLKQEKKEEQIVNEENRTLGVICDVAPTILELMEIPIPPEMKGKSLLQYLK